MSKLTQLDTFEKLSKEDYGPYLTEITLYQLDNRFILEEKYGYSEPYDSTWYELPGKPAKPLTELFTGNFVGGGGQEIVEECLEVDSITEIEDPEIVR